MTEAGNLRPFKSLDDDVTLAVKRDTYTNYFYTDNYLVILTQENGDYGNSVYISIYKKSTWELIKSGYFNNISTKGFASISISITYADKAYFISNTNDKTIYEIIVDENQSEKYTVNTLTLPRGISNYVSTTIIGKTLYLFGCKTDSSTSITASTTFTTIIKFDAQTRSCTVLGISISDMGFSAGSVYTPSSSNPYQNGAGVYAAMPYSNNSILIIGKHADTEDKTTRLILWNLSTNAYQNVSTDLNFSYLKNFLMYSKFVSTSSSSITASRKHVYADDMVLYRGSHSIAMQTGTSSSNYVWYNDDSTSAYFTLILNIIIDIKNQKIYKLWLPENTTTTMVNLSSSYAGIDTKWVSAGNKFTQVPVDTRASNIDLRSSRIYDLERKTIQAFSFDATDGKIRSVGAYIIDFVVVVKKDSQVKPFTELPLPIQVKFIRPSNLSIINIEPDAEGYYEVPEECYMYMAVENNRSRNSQYYPLEGYPYSRVNPFKILVR